MDFNQIAIANFVDFMATFFAFNIAYYYVPVVKSYLIKNCDGFPIRQQQLYATSKSKIEFGEDAIVSTAERITFMKRIEEANNQYEKSRVDHNRPEWLQFNSKLHGLFLASALYCFVILIFCGFEKAIVLHKDAIYTFLLSFNLSCIILYGLCFLTYLYEIVYNKSVKFARIIAFFLSFFLGFFVILPGREIMFLFMYATIIIIAVIPIIIEFFMSLFNHRMEINYLILSK